MTDTKTYLTGTQDTKKRRRLVWVRDEKLGGYRLKGLKLTWPFIRLIRRTEEEPSWPGMPPYRAGSWRLSGMITASFPETLSDDQAKQAALRMIRIWISTLEEDPRIVK